MQMKKVFLIFTLITLLLFVACGVQPTSTAPATEEAQEAIIPAAQATPEGPFPPLVLQTAPATGVETEPDTALEVQFDQPMDQASVEAAFSIKPEATGDFAWADETTLRFTPDQALTRGQRYEVTIDTSAESAVGLPLNRDFEFAFSTISFLEVTTVQPEDGATEIDPDTIVTVLFNRPVVALSAIEDQGSLPDPLTFVPPVTGDGEWLNTSIYQFTPDEGFIPGTEYTARVAAGLKDLDGSTLEDDFTWTFSTASPTVVASYPQAGDIYVSTTPVISVAFNQPMDHASVEKAFTLEATETGEAVEGTFTWVEEGLAQPIEPYSDYYYYTEDGTGPAAVGVETLAFQPDEPLEYGVPYAVTIGRTARGRLGSGSTLRQAYDFGFNTVPTFEIVSTYPADDSDALYYDSLQITFSAPVDPASVDVGRNLLINPSVAVTDVYTYFWESNTQLNVNFPTEASSAYTVSLLSNIKSRYGQALGTRETIHWRTSALEPWVYLHAPGYQQISTYSTYTATQAYVTVRNTSAVDFALYHLPEEDFLRLNGENSWQERDSYFPDEQDLIREWQVETAPELNHNAIYGTNLAGEPGGILEPGLYFLFISIDPDNYYPEAEGLNSVYPTQQMLVVSDYNLTFKTAAQESLAWLTDLSGQPVEDAPVRFLTEFDALGEDTTDEMGVAQAEHDYFDAWRPRFAISDQPFAVAMNTWSDGIERWQYGVSTEDYLQPLNGYFYTDRAIYRPGQTVYFKGIIRQDDDAHYTIPVDDGTMVGVTVYDSQSKEIFSDEYPLNGFGTLNGQIDLDEEAALGYYTINVLYDQVGFSAGFQVAEFRKPEFLVDVTTDQPEYVNGDTIQLTAQANFFFGGALANTDVTYNILSEDYAFNYTSPGGYFDFTDYDFSRAMDSYYYGFGELIDEGSGQTDGTGAFSLDVPADIASRLASQRFILEVTVTDPDTSQVVSNRTQVIVHKGDFYIGLKPQRYVSTAGEEAAIDVITVDWDSQPAADKELTVVFAEHNWYSVQEQSEDGSYYWTSEVQTIPVLTTTIETDDEGRGVAEFTPEKGGIYKVTALGADSDGNEIRSSTYMWVSGSEFVNWRQENNDRIELVADKRQYNVGDVATILIPHPYSDTVTALVTQERGRIYDYNIYSLPTNSEQIEISITEDMLPNMFVSVVIMKGPDEANPLASFKVGYAQLPINVAEKEINITLTPDKPAGELYQPRDEVTYDIVATDSEGNPVEAEFSLALVDKAILTLASESGYSILDQFWRERGLGVGTATTLAISAERVNLNVAPESKGGGGGFDEAFSVVRGEFKDTAYWVADFQTDADGHGFVAATLPDNLTTWVLTARGITVDTLVGDEQVEIVSTKPVLVRPVAPRFFVVGDEAELSMVVQNNSRDDLDVTALFEGEGLELIGGEAEADLEVEAGGKATLTYPVRIDQVDEVTLRFGAKSSEYQDAVEITLPVYRHSTPETVGTAGVLDEDGRRLEGIALPGSFDPTQGELSVKIEPSLAAGTIAGLRYLEHFPYECTEQTVSRFLPNVVTYRAYQTLNLDRPDLAQSLPGLVSTGLQRLYGQQHLDGGWGWWTFDESNPFLTAYVLLGLLEADRTDFSVDQDVMDNAVRYLEQSLRQPRDVVEPWQANRQAFILYVLAEADAGDMGRTVSLFDQREKLDLYGRAYLAMAFNLLAADDSRIATLLSDITGEAVASATGAHWEEAQPDYYNMNTDTRSTAIVLAALSRLDPDNPLAPNAVRWLMSIRQNDRWESTQETAWGVMALTDWMVATGELDGNYAWNVALNGEAVGDGTVSSDNIDEATTLTVAVKDLLANEVNRLIIERDPQDGVAESLGRLYYTAHLEYFKPVEEVKALDRGIIVARQYTLATDDDEDKPAQAISQAKVGDIINVKLTIIAPHDLHYVLVEDPFPAGTEAIDTSLNTTSVVGEQPELSRERGNGWGWWWFSHTELRDEKAALFATYLPRGTYEYTYQIRASLPGEYRVLPSHAEEMYFPEVFGRGDGGVFTITE